MFTEGTASINHGVDLSFEIAGGELLSFAMTPWTDAELSGHLTMDSAAQPIARTDDRPEADTDFVVYAAGVFPIAGAASLGLEASADPWFLSDTALGVDTHGVGYYEQSLDYDGQRWSATTDGAWEAQADTTFASVSGAASPAVDLTTRMEVSLFGIQQRTRMTPRLELASCGLDAIAVTSGMIASADPDGTFAAGHAMDTLVLELPAEIISEPVDEDAMRCLTALD